MTPRIDTVQYDQDPYPRDEHFATAGSESLDRNSVPRIRIRPQGNAILGSDRLKYSTSASVSRFWEPVFVMSEIDLESSEPIETGTTPLLRNSPAETYILDWDAWLEEPPARATGAVQVKLNYRGRSKPLPVDDPWA